MLRRLFEKFFPVVEKEPWTLVFFDGDQGLRPFDMMYRDKPNFIYHWVQNAHGNMPKKIRAASKKVRFSATVPSCCGKEPVDTFIAMKLVQSCCSKNPPAKVVITSCDMDFIDVIINAARMFVKIKFILMVERGKASQPNKHIGVEFPSNASIVFFKGKP